MPIPQQRHVKLAIKHGNEVIKEFKQHSTGRLNLWVSITDLSQKYNITRHRAELIPVLQQQL